MKHVIHMQLTGGKLFNAPIAPNPQRILDLCTGTGLWPIEGKLLAPNSSAHLTRCPSAIRQC